MAYDYKTQRPCVFTDKGQDDLFVLIGTALRKLRFSGAVDFMALTKGITGDSWDMLAYTDYLIEKGFLREVTNSACAGQFRVFTAGPRLRDAI